MNKEIEKSNHDINYDYWFLLVYFIFTPIVFNIQNIIFVEQLDLWITHIRFYEYFIYFIITKKVMFQIKLE
jgi:hypothetical protein